MPALSTILFTVGVFLLGLSVLCATVLIFEPPQRTTRRRAREAFWRAMTIPAANGLAGAVMLAIAVQIA